MIDHLLDIVDAIAQPQHFHRDFVRRQHSLWRQQDPDLPGLIEFQLGMRWQDRPAGFADGDIADTARHRLPSNRLLLFGNERARRDVAFDVSTTPPNEVNRWQVAPGW